MKIRLHIQLLMLGIFSMVLTGCPVAIEHPPGIPGTEKLDKDLLGTWYTTDADREVISIELSEVDKYQLKAVVLEAGEMYSLESKELIGWCTEIGGLKCVYFKSAMESEEGYFNYYYKFDNGKLETYVVSLLDGGVDAVTSTEAYRIQAEKSMQMAGGISDTTHWIRK